MEYEYSIKVDSLDKYIKYCIDNDYKLMFEGKQTRIIYRNNGMMARITINKENNQLDFKEDILNDNELIERKESKSITFDSLENVASILEFLNFKEDNTIVRNRKIYKKNNVKFELDEYQDKTIVLAVEGVKEEVDKVWNELKN